MAALRFKTGEDFRHPQPPFGGGGIARERQTNKQKKMTHRETRDKQQQQSIEWIWFNNGQLQQLIETKQQP